MWSKRRIRARAGYQDRVLGWSGAAVGIGTNHAAPLINLALETDEWIERVLPRPREQQSQ